MLNIEQKKKLAEWMGWQLDPMVENYYYTPNRNWHLNEWKPDRKHKHFAEVWNKLSEGQQEDVMFLGADSSKTWTKTLLNNLPKVMDAVLEVLGYNIESGCLR